MKYLQLPQGNWEYIGGEMNKIMGWIYVGFFTHQNITFIHNLPSKEPH